MANITITKLYNLYNVITEAKENGSKHEKEFKEILSGIKGGIPERRLASQFITQFFTLFPDQQEQALTAQFDLCEDTDMTIRRQAIKNLPAFCKVKKDVIPKVADILAQLLQMEDQAEINGIQNSLAILLRLDAKATMTGLFFEINNSGDELVKERCLKFIQAKLKTMPDVFTKDIEDIIVKESKIVLKDATESDFLLMVSILKELPSYSTVTGRLHIIELVSEQCKVTQAVGKKDLNAVKRFATCIKQIVPFFSSQIKSSIFVEYAFNQILPLLALAESELSLSVIKSVAEMIPFAGSMENQDKKVAVIFALLIAQMPLPPADPIAASTELETMSTSLPFSRVESLLFAFHSLARNSQEFLTGNAERLKDFRTRLQYFSRGSQAYQKALQEALKVKSTDATADDLKLKRIALRMTTNINTLIKDLFHQPPSFKAIVQLSFKEKSRPAILPATPEVAAAPVANGVKRHAPISMDGLAKSKVQKVEPRKLYSAPRGGRGGRGRGIRGRF